MRGFVRGVLLGFGVGGGGGGVGSAFGGADQFAHLELVALALGLFRFAAEGDLAIGDELVEVFEEVFVVAHESGVGLFLGWEQGDGRVVV